MPGLPDDIIPKPPPQQLVALRQEIASLNQYLIQAKERGDAATGLVKLLKKLLRELLVEKEQQSNALSIELAAEKSKHRDG